MTDTTQKDMEDTDAMAPQTGFLAAVERIGNKIPDPAMLFVALLFVVWVLSWLLSYISFEVIDPRTGAPIVINNQLTGTAITTFMSSLVTNFSGFGPVGTVLVAMQRHQHPIHHDRAFIIERLLEIRLFEGIFTRAIARELDPAHC